ncbi:MAG: alpha/beta fold hydrolase [bacterium]
MSHPLELHTDIQGQGPAVLFLPGLGGNHKAFAGIQKLLSDKRQTIAIDPRDTGSSPRALADYTLDDMAADVLHLIDRLGLDQADIVGHSMGGMIAQHLAVMAPERIRSMVLMSCHARNYPWKSALVESWIELRQQQDTVTFTRHTLPWLLGAKAFENPAHIQGMIRHVERNPIRQEPEAFARQARAVLVHDVLSQLHLLEMPVLVVAGSVDRVTPPETSKILADHIPRSHFELFEEVGHLPHIEAPGRLATLLARFLDDPWATTSANRNTVESGA